MAYEPQTWVDHQTSATAARMNHMEEGIAQAHGAAELPDTGWLTATLVPTGLPSNAVMRYRRIGNVVYLSGQAPGSAIWHIPIDASSGTVLWNTPTGFRPTQGLHTPLGIARSGDDVRVYTQRSSTTSRLTVVGTGNWYPGGCYVTDDNWPA